MFDGNAKDDEFLRIGDWSAFVFRGERFEKTGHGMAFGAGIGHVFPGVVDVVAGERVRHCCRRKRLRDGNRMSGIGRIIWGQRRGNDSILSANRKRESRGD